ncbi:MAG TPA: L-serine ammonia-lyase, iron-sulfur-dependent subunit beta [Abditibacteriaceae bacterium]|jgi:L-serine dehydratase
MFSAFEIIGPVMVGPSSSHTAGACRIGLMARRLLGEAPREVVIGLHGSFAATGEGHATDRALVAGILGLAPDDEQLRISFDLARAAKVRIEIDEVDLGENAHPNSVCIEAKGSETSICVIASSTGGGAIRVTQINQFGVELSGQLESIVAWHGDTPGFLGRIAAVCACVELNIATARTSRHERGEEALTVIEVDGKFDDDLLSILRRSKGTTRLVHLPILPGF